MADNLTEALTLSTAWAAVAAWFASVALRIGSRENVRRLAAARWTWTAGCLLVGLHVACAFHFVHGWSHAAAKADIARQTREVMQLDFAGGVYFNYALLLVWLADAAWWQVRPQRYLRRHAAWDIAVHGFLTFMFLSAAVVFAEGALRWLSAAAFVLLAVLWTSSVKFEKQSAE